MVSNVTPNLFRIDPTEAFVQYVQTIKPYHTKILETLVEYVYTEDVNVTIDENLQISTTFITPPIPPTYTCDWGNVWGAFDPEAERIIGADTNTNSFLIEIPPIVSQDFTVSNLASGQCTVDGIITLQWKSGTPVEVSSTGTLPQGLLPNTTYYFIPSETIGVFNLALTPRPQHRTDYVFITDQGSGTLSVQRVQKYTAGFYLRVTNSRRHNNDGFYVVLSAVEESPNLRLYVDQPIKSDFISSVGRLYDGFISYGYNTQLVGADATLNTTDDIYTTPCVLAASDPLYTYTTIGEKLVFEFTVSLKDSVQSFIGENQSRDFGVASYGDSPYGLGTPSLAEMTVTTGGFMVPTGVDGQVWDLGGFDENTHTLQLLYGTTVTP